MINNDAAQLSFDAFDSAFVHAFQNLGTLGDGRKIIADGIYLGITAPMIRDGTFTELASKDGIVYYQISDKIDGQPNSRRIRLFVQKSVLGIWLALDENKPDLDIVCETTPLLGTMMKT